MRFLVISDTHDNVNAIRDLIKEVKKEKLDFVVHAGDVISPFAIRELEGLGKIAEKIYIAFGNNDGDREKLMEIAISRGWVIGDIVTFPTGCAYHGTNPNMVKMLSKRYEFVIRGHTHRRGVERIEGEATVVNPGEVCGYLTGVRSYAMVEGLEVSFIEF
jgi:hypothetical protein